MDHLSDQIIDQHHQRKLSASQLLAVDEHLAECDQCHLIWLKKRANVEEKAASIDQVFDLSVLEDDHLPYETLEALVDDTASEVDREIAEVHLEVCSRCVAELHALEDLRDQKPGIVSHQRQAAKPSLIASWSWPKLAIAAAVVLAVGAILWIVWKSQQTSREPVTTQLATAPSPTNVSSPIPTPTASPAPELVDSLRDGTLALTLDSTGKISGLDDLSPAIQERIKRTLTTGQLNVGPALAGLRGRDGTLMGSRTEGVPFRLLSPVGVVVQNDRPTFRWERYEGATAYVVKVYDSNFKEMASSLSQTATSWSIPLALARGAIYNWQVTAIKDGQEIKSPSAPATPARFRVLATDRLNEIRNAQRTKPASHLALGTLYAEAGLIPEARREFQILLRANPDSKIVQKLIRELNGR